MTDSTFRVADLAGAGDALRAGGERVPTWVTKEAGNRRLPFDAERLQRSIDAVHAEFPQLDVSDYRRVVQAMVERKPSISADDLVDLDRRWKELAQTQRRDRRRLLHDQQFAGPD